MFGVVLWNPYVKSMSTKTSGHEDLITADTGHMHIMMIRAIQIVLPFMICHSVPNK